MNIETTKISAEFTDFITLDEYVSVSIEKIGPSTWILRQNNYEFKLTTDLLAKIGDLAVSYER